MHASQETPPGIIQICMYLSLRNVFLIPFSLPLIFGHCYEEDKLVALGSHCVGGSDGTCFICSQRRGFIVEEAATKRESLILVLFA